MGLLREVSEKVAAKNMVLVTCELPLSNNLYRTFMHVNDCFMTISLVLFLTSKFHFACAYISIFIFEIKKNVQLTIGIEKNSIPGTHIEMLTKQE